MLKVSAALSSIPHASALRCLSVCFVGVIRDMKLAVSSVRNASDA